MLCSCFASDSLIDKQAARPGFYGSGYGTRPRVLVFVGSGYDDPTDSERTPNVPDPQKPDRAACRSIRLEEIARKTITEHTVN